MTQTHGKRLLLLERAPSINRQRVGEEREAHTEVKRFVQGHTADQLGIGLRLLEFQSSAASYEPHPSIAIYYFLSNTFLDTQSHTLKEQWTSQMKAPDCQYIYLRRYQGPESAPTEFQGAELNSTYIWIIRGLNNKESIKQGDRLLDCTRRLINQDFTAL